MKVGIMQAQQRKLKITVLKIGAIAFCAVALPIFFQNCTDFELEGTHLASNGASNPSWPTFNGTSADDLPLINFGVHTGGVSGASAKINGYLFPSQPPSGWYVTQWKKIRPIRHDVDLKAPDGKYLFNLQRSDSDESRFAAFQDSSGKIIYEMSAHKGHMTSVGGSNLFLSANLAKSVALNRKVVFSFETKLLKSSANVLPAYKSDEATLLQRDVLTSYLGGFPVAYDDGNPDNRANMFIQFYLSDSRHTKAKNPNPGVYRGFYPHGTSMEIVGGIPINQLTGIASDYKLELDTPSAPMTKYEINLSKLLCMALNGTFRRTDGVANEQMNFATAKGGIYTKNLKSWKVGSLYLGFENQAVYFDEVKDSAKFFYPPSHPLYGGHNVREDIQNEMITKGAYYKGNVEIAAELANMRMLGSADGSSVYENCTDALASAPGTSGATIDLIDQVVAPVPTATPKPPATPVPTATPKPPATPVPTATPVANQCTVGAFISGQSGIQYACGCAASSSVMKLSGWVSQGDGCYHRVADSFCSSSLTKTFWVCGLTTTPQGSGWVTQPNACYHLASSLTCN